MKVYRYIQDDLNEWGEEPDYEGSLLDEYRHARAYSKYTKRDFKFANTENIVKIHYDFVTIWEYYIEFEYSYGVKFEYNGSPIAEVEFYSLDEAKAFVEDNNIILEGAKDV